MTKRDMENVAVKFATIVLAIAFVTPSTLAFAGPMNLADPKLVPSQSSTQPPTAIRHHVEIDRRPGRYGNDRWDPYGHWGTYYGPMIGVP